MGAMTNDWRGSIIAAAVAAAGGSAAQATFVAHLMPSDMYNLLAAPFVVVPPQGGIFQPTFCAYGYVHKTTDYTIGDAAQFFIGPPDAPTSKNVLLAVGTNLIDGSTIGGDVIVTAPAVNSAIGSWSGFNDTSLVLTHNGTGELADGDGELWLSIVGYTVTGWSV